MANYLIIGGDGKEYGPVSEADLRQWITDGRLNGQSLAKSESDAEFRPLSTFPEFSNTLGASTPPTIQPLAPAASAFTERDYELDLGGCVTRGYNAFKEHFSTLFVATLAYAAIEGIITLLAMIPFVGALFSIGNLIISGPLVAGLLWVCLRALRNENPEAGDLFEGFRRNFVQLFLGKLIPGLIALLCLIPAFIVFFITILPATAHHQQPDPQKLLILIPVVLVCMLPVLYLATCWFFTLPLILDKNMDFASAMKTSWRMVNKHWWQVFGLTLLIGLINVVGALLCLVGLLFTVPIGYAAMMAAYETIFVDKKN